MQGMSATFIIKTSFKLSTRKLFVLGGVIISGEVSKGMVLVDDGKGLDIEINSVEFIDSKSHPVQVGITFKYKNDNDLTALKLFKQDDVVTFR
jgi:hypothetical protein